METQIESKQKLKTLVRKHKRMIIKSVFASLLTILVVVAAVYVCQKSIAAQYNRRSLDLRSDAVFGEIIDGTIIRQTVRTNESAEGVSLLFATYGRENAGNLSVVIKDMDTNSILYQKTLDANVIADNAYYDFYFDKDSKSKNFEITIVGEDTLAGKAPTIWMSSASNPDLELYQNGTKTNGSLVIELLNKITGGAYGMLASRLTVILVVAAFLYLHVFLDIRKMYGYIFKYRVVLALLLIAFCVVNQFHFSSVTMFDSSVQPRQGSEFSIPVFGEARAIRSDEWLVSTPSKLSAAYTDYSEYNTIMRAEKTQNLPASGLYLSYSALANPLNWGYYILGPIYGHSLHSSASLILSLLVSFEICYILSRNNKLYGVVGASLITLSSFFMWSFAGWILTAQATLVCIYYLLNTKKRIPRLLFGVGAVIWGSSFLLPVNPVWLVPVLYVFIAVLISIIYDARDNIKKFRALDITILLGCLLFMISILSVYKMNIQEYTSVLRQTVYPGQNTSTGGNALYKLANYIPGILYPYRNVGNPSEMSIFMNLFPLPVFLNIYYMIKAKKINILALGLIIVSSVLTIFCLTEIPATIVKLTLLSYSTPERAVEVLAFAQIYLLIVALTGYEKVKKIGFLPALMVVGTVLVFTSRVAYNNFSLYIGGGEVVLIGIVLLLLFTLLISNVKPVYSKAAVGGIVALSLISCITVNPLVKSLDVLYTKPISYKIQEIVKNDPDGKWLALDSIVDSGFLIANGAPTINSVNIIPKYDMWELIDPTGKDKILYNRYAHLTISFTEEETSMELLGEDSLHLSLNPLDLKKTDVDYIMSSQKIGDTEAYKLNCLYAEFGKYIYLIDYQD